jgi:hypothetical protein
MGIFYNKFMFNIVLANKLYQFDYKDISTKKNKIKYEKNK